MKNLKKFLIIAACIGLAASTTKAQLLWKVSGKDAKGTNYIFGTHHIAPPTMIDSVPGLKDAIQTTDKTVGEVVMKDLTSPESQIELATKYMMAPADSTLSRVLTPLQMDSLNNLLGSLTGGMVNASALDKMKPAIVGMQIVMIENMKLFPGFNPQDQIDGKVQQFATEAGKPTGSLETVDEQMQLLYGTSIQDQVKDLMNNIRNFDSDCEKSRKLAEAYINQNLDNLEELFQPEDAAEADKLEKLLYERNHKWTEKIKSILPTETVVICVGAGHLPGEDGLLNLLRKEGYTVEPAIK